MATPPAISTVISAKAVREARIFDAVATMTRILTVAGPIGTFSWDGQGLFS